MAIKLEEGAMEEGGEGEGRERQGKEEGVEEAEEQLEVSHLFQAQHKQALFHVYSFILLVQKHIRATRTQVNKKCGDFKNTFVILKDVYKNATKNCKIKS